MNLSLIFVGIIHTQSVNEDMLLLGEFYRNTRNAKKVVFFRMLRIVLGKKEIEEAEQRFIITHEKTDYSSSYG